MVLIRRKKATESRTAKTAKTAKATKAKTTKAKKPVAARKTVAVRKPVEVEEEVVEVVEEPVVADPPKRRRGRPLGSKNKRKKAPKVLSPEPQPAPIVVSADDDVDEDRNEFERHWKIVLKRQWDMLQTLTTSPAGMTLEELAAKFDVSEKTIKRDLKSLEYAFGQMKSKNEAHGRKRYYYDSNPFSFSLSLDRDELLAIYVGQTLMSPLRGTYFWDNLQTSREKIKSILREETVAYAERVAPFFHRFEPMEMHYSDQMRKLIDQALISMVDSCALRIKYRSIKARRTKTYEIFPYNFVYWNSAIYLIGFCCRDRKVKIWKVDRLFDAQSIPKKKFSRVNFDVNKFLENATSPYVGETPIKRVTIRFTGYAARIVEEEKLRSIKRMTHEPSGAVTVEMDTETGKSFTRWILGFGRHAEILAPSQLREEFYEELESVRKLYRRDVEDPVDYYNRYERAFDRDRRKNRGAIGYDGPEVVED